MENLTISLRTLILSDLPLLRKIELDPDNKQYSTLEQPSEKDLLDFLNSEHNYYLNKQIRYVILVDGIGVGFVDLSDATLDYKTASTGIIILPEWRRKRIALKALQLLIEKSRKLNINKLEALILFDNKSSIQLYSKAGFQLEEIKDEFYLYSLDLLNV